MQELLIRLWRLWPVYLFAICFPIIAGASIQAGWESYEDRPDILEIPVRPGDLGGQWESLKAAHFSFLAELFALYAPDTHIYFLGRDSEYLYDAARLATQGTADFHRIHLVNISRANMRQAEIGEYLNQNGITEESLISGKKVLFVDTGFTGTIPRVIAERFSARAQKNLKAHLIVSSNREHPSARTFLVHLNPTANSSHPSNMHGTICNYETMVRYTDRSTRFVRYKGRVHPLSPLDSQSDGLVSKTEALNHMSDLKAYWQNPEVQAGFHAEKQQIEQLVELLTLGGEENLSKIKFQMENEKDVLKRRLLEAQIRDLFEAKNNAGREFQISSTDLGFAAPAVSSVSYVSKKTELAKKYPEWASILEDPVSKIPQLFKEKNWQMIGNLIDADVDSEFNRVLARSLFNEMGSGIKKEMQTRMIKVAGAGTHDELIKKNLCIF